MEISGRYQRIYQLMLLVIAIYFFLFSIKLMSSSFKLMGSDFAESLVSTTADPFIGLMIGILITAVIQSSSSTTSMLVALVGGGLLPLRAAIPMVMGANIGTTVTNKFVALGHLTRKHEFKQAFAGATVHDFFYLFTVLVLFPIELYTHFLEKTAMFMATSLVGTSGLEFQSPVNAIVGPLVGNVVHLLPPFIMVISSIVIMLGTLALLVKCTRTLFAAASQNFLSKYLFKTAAISFGVGVGLTALVQSSSITTSIIIPFLGSGMLSVEQVFPYMIGAHVGTTVTALLASLATNSTAAVAVALAHFLFNIIGVLIVFPIRAIPIKASRKLGSFMSEKRSLAFLYILLIYYLLPILVLLLMGVVKIW